MASLLNWLLDEDDLDVTNWNHYQSNDFLVKKTQSELASLNEIQVRLQRDTNKPYVQLSEMDALKNILVRNLFYQNFQIKLGDFLRWKYYQNKGIALNKEFVNLSQLDEFYLEAKSLSVDDLYNRCLPFNLDL